MKLTQEIQNYIHESFLFAHQPVTLSPADSLLDKGIIDSTGVLELISFLENQYQIQIKDDEILPDNLDSIEKITRFIKRKQAGEA
ncbi:acyl carrier protein [candidate division KSB1 bacterium]|nr:acyl carrier protein [candidate division KSB1 bacterium]